MKVGDLEIIQILDGEWITPMPPGLPEMSDEELAQHRDYLRPDGKMLAALGGFVVRTGNQVVLIDAGLGPAPHSCESADCGHDAHKGGGETQPIADFEEFFRQKGAPEAQIAWFKTMLEQQSLHHGWLPVNLHAKGIRPEEVTDVILSHLHPDHMGWVARDGTPFFPKAKLWAHQADVDLFLGKESPDETSFKVMLGVESTKQRMAPVHDQIHTWQRDFTVAPGIDLRWLPGHTPGSSITVVSSGDERAMVLGDVIHCPLELVDNDFAIMADIDPAMAKKSKAIVRDEIEGTNVHVSSSHFPGLKFGRLLAGKGKRQWSWA
jgi:glyoxylase-like metal-dependent hydrolase (beta-lactamase superfamily II)